MPNTSIDFMKTSTQQRVPILARDNLDGAFSLGVWARGADRFSTSTQSTSGVVTTGQGVLGDFFVIASAGATLRIWDSATASGAVLLNTLTFAGGFTGTLPLRGQVFGEGIFVEISGTAQVVARWQGV